MLKRYLSLAKFYFYIYPSSPRVFTHKWSEGEVDKRRDKGSLTEARGINQVQADEEIETGKRKDRKMSPSIWPCVGLLLTRTMPSLLCFSKHLLAGR